MPQPDPFDQLSKLYGLRPGVQETYNHTSHTQVTIPWRQYLLATWVRFMGYLGVVMGVMLLLVIFWAADQDPQKRSLILICFAVLVIGTLLAGATKKPRQLLLQRLESEIEDPFRDSPMIELMREFLERDQPEPDEKIRYVPLPYQTWQGKQKDKAGPEPDQPRVSDDFLDLVEFTQIAAAGRGLTRSAWCGENAPRVRLPSGKYVSKSVWSEMIAELVDWGIVDRGGDGLATDWRVDPGQAVAMLKDAASHPHPDALWQPEEEIP